MGACAVKEHDTRDVRRERRSVGEGMDPSEGVPGQHERSDLTCTAEQAVQVGDGAGRVRAVG